MPSPFPGMNPYLEQPSCWESLHDALAFAAAEALIPLVRPKYLVKPRQRLYIHEAASETRHHLGAGDVGVSEVGPGGSSPVAVAAHILAPAYGVIPPPAEVEKQTYLEIEDREQDRVVTTVEILSPSNKRNPGDRAQYLAKRRDVLRSDVHLVEIDLLRGGRRMPMEDLPDSDYCAIVSRSYERPRAGIWTWILTDPIPVLPIPLNEGDDDVLLDLKPLIEGIHDRLGFADYIYRTEPEPRLSPDDHAWAQALLNHDQA